MSKASPKPPQSPAIPGEIAYPSALLDRAHALATREAKAGYLDLAKAVATMSETYVARRDSLADLRGASARYVGTLAFFFARDFPKAVAVFEELHRRALLPKGETLRVLDLGAGLGTTSLGFARVAKARGLCSRMRLDAVEIDAGALVHLRELADGADELAAMSIEAHATRMESFAREARGPFDVVTLGLSLNELANDPAEREALLARLVSLLAPGGVLVVVEPALHDVTRALMQLRDRLALRDEVAILGPCTHRAPCPMLAAGERDWCHAELELTLPEREAKIAARAGLRDDKPTFAWLALGRAVDRATKADAHLVRVVSRPLTSKGKTELAVCAERGLVRLRALDRDEVDPALDGFVRGELAELEGPAVLEASIRLGKDASLSRVGDR